MEVSTFDESRPFRGGSMKPGVVVAVVAMVVSAAVLGIFALKGGQEKMSKEEIAKEQRSISELPRAQRTAKWRTWASRADVPQLQQDAFAQLAWAKDAQSIPAIIAGLSSTDHRVRGTAAMALVEFGSPAADAGKPSLLKALGEAENSDKPQIAWALTALHESSSFDAILAEYRAGHLASVQRLDGSPTFDPEVLVAMVPIEKLSSYADDPSDSLRQLVATALSRAAEPKWTAALTKLVKDKEVQVAREAAVGLGKIANESSMAPLLSALSTADKDSRGRFLEALRDGVGAKGLVLALKSVTHENYDREKHQTKQIFEMLRELADPRAGDFLVDYLRSQPPPHFRTEAALRMAEVGDMRSVPTLAWRMKQDPLVLYSAALDPEFRIDDNERVVSARMLADLAVLHPGELDVLRKEAEPSVLFWAKNKPQPHANALRFLAASRSTGAAPDLRRWASPKEPLPKSGQTDFPPSWATAQSALRYLGWLRDPSSFSLLEHQMFRKPAEIDATMDGLMQGGIAVLGMTVRGLSVGAAEGFAQWGDSKAYPYFVKYIEDTMNNEQSRVAACSALSWVATDAQMGEVVRKVNELNQPDVKKAFVRACYLETLIHRPVAKETGKLLAVLRPDVEVEVRHQAARAIGFGGVSPEVAEQLRAKLKDAALRNDAMLALLLGADSDTVARSLATYNDVPAETVEELKVIYGRSFGYWSDRNYEEGDVARWVANAEAAAYVTVHGALCDWPRQLLARALQGIEFDNGPHSLTRVQLRARLQRDAKSDDAGARDNAITTLQFMKEKGVLMALRNEQGPVAELARQAYFRLLNPKLGAVAAPEASAAAKAP